MSRMLKQGALIATLMVAGGVEAQVSQGKTTQIKGNTEINVEASEVTAIAAGRNNVAKNRIGVIKGEKKGNTKINVATKNVTTVVGGSNKKACTNIGGIVDDDCN